MSAVAAGIGLGGALIIGGGLSAAGAIGGAAISSGAAGSAAQTQANASNHAADIENQQFLQQQKNIQPWIQAGATALPQLQDMSKNPATFTPQQFQNNQDPAYQFDLQQGQQALERSAAASGQLMSGGTLKDLTNYSQGMASNEYSNSYNRFMNNQNTQFNRLASLSGIGQTGTGQLGTIGMNAANSMGNIATAQGNAAGAASIAQGNIWGGTLSGIGNNMSNGLMTYGMMNRPNMYGNGAGYGAFSQMPNLDTQMTMPSFGSGAGYSSPTLSLMGS